MRTIKLHNAGTAANPAWQYFGYVDGVAVYQSTKLWRYRSDCARAARAWERGT